MVEISIIVPVYKVERYLDQCIQSIICQTFSNFELILIDDGSPDNCGQICDNYAKIDNRIKVLHTKNRGVSVARNKGIEVASGEWLMFIDSDDFIGKHYLAAFHKYISDYKLDFVHGGCINCSEAGDILTQEQYYNILIDENKYILLESFRGLTFSKLFKKSIIDRYNIKFDSKVRLAEDMIFTIEYLTYVHNYAFIEEDSYYYRRRNLSASTSVKQSYQEAIYAFTKRKLVLNTYRNINNISGYTMREMQLASILVSIISKLYNEGLSRRIRIKHLKEDFNYYDLQILGKYNGTIVKRLLLNILINRYYNLFDNLASGLFWIKKRIHSNRSCLKNRCYANK